MCGLVGMIGDIREPHKKMFRDMLVFDQVRGFDSTGIIAIPIASSINQADDQNVIMDKTIGCAQNLWDYDRANLYNTRGIINPGVKVLIGHNRAATVGSITEDNAHPFNFGHVYGAHNGSLTYYSDLEGAKDFDVDSMAIFKDIEVHGIDHTWKNFYGAACLTWWDAKEDQLNIVRNGQRPLHIVKSEDGKTLFWASELWMITAAAMRAKVKLAKKDGVTDHFSPKEHTLYKIEASAVNFEIVEERELEKKSTSIQVYGTNGTNGRIGTGGNRSVGGFKHPKQWKKGTVRTSLSREGLSLSNLRQVSIIGKNNSFEDFFRLDMFRAAGTGIKLIGRLDIVAHNNAEYKKLQEASRKDFEGKGPTISLVNGPRRYNLGPSSFVRYMCAFSSLQLTYPEEVATEYFLGNDGSTPVTLEEAKKQLRVAGDCCSYCSTSIEPCDLKDVAWLAKDQVLCGECDRNWSPLSDTLAKGHGKYAN